MGILGTDRKRCLRCRKYFTWFVVDGKWCSNECAGRVGISDNPDDWPRRHYVPAGPGGPKRPKVQYTHQEADIAAENAGKTAYHCTYCGNWHIGSRSGDES
jgi:hypothetical protein